MDEQRREPLENAGFQFGNAKDLFELTAAEKQELDRRLAAHDAAPQDVLTWEQIKERVRRKT